MAQREELTRFLKAARARLDPATLGLPRGERRRAPGLRREEVAALAGMSVTWYTWFEQGRQVQLSAPMLERLSAAMRLKNEEREFLFALSQHRPPPLMLPPDEIVRPSTQHMLDSLNIPAQVLTEYWTVIAWNALTARVFRDYNVLAPADRNLFKILLLSPEYQRDEAAYRDIVRRITARLKWDYSRTTKLEYFDALIDECSDRSPTFREFWDRSDIVAHFEGIHSVAVKGVGDITFRHTSYAIEQSPSQRLMLFAPLDDESAIKLGSLHNLSN